MRISDLHCDTTLELQAGADLGDEQSTRHVNIPKLRQGNIGLQVFAAFVSSLIPKNKAFDEANELFDRIEDSCQKYPQYLQLVEEVDQVKAVFASDKTGIMLALENGHAIEKICYLNFFRVLEENKS
jgi:membrane dipeptidase